MNFAQPTYSYSLYDVSCSATNTIGEGIVFPLDFRSDVDLTDFYFTLKLANFNGNAAQFSVGAIDFDTDFVQNFNTDTATGLVITPVTIPANSIMDYTVKFRVRNKTVVNLRTGYDIEWYLQVSIITLIFY